MFFLIFFLILPQISEIMVSLPADFVAETRRIMGEERFNRFVGAFEEEAPTSIRVNTRILDDGLRVMGDGGNQVPWCAEGYYLEDRPQFTFDPLLHAGWWCEPLSHLSPPSLLWISALRLGVSLRHCAAYCQRRVYW